MSSKKFKERVQTVYNYADLRLASIFWPVKLPEGLPKCERCTFAWTWINAIGNREYYMNCADIQIVGGISGSGIRGIPLKIANLPGYPVVHPPVNNNGPDGSQILHYPIQRV